MSDTTTTKRARRDLETVQDDLKQAKDALFEAKKVAAAKKNYLMFNDGAEAFFAFQDAKLKEIAAQENVDRLQKALTTVLEADDGPQKRARLDPVYQRFQESLSKLREERKKIEARFKDAEKVMFTIKAAYDKACGKHRNIEHRLRDVDEDIVTLFSANRDVIQAYNETCVIVYKNDKRCPTCGAKFNRKTLKCTKGHAFHMAHHGIVDLMPGACIPVKLHPGSEDECELHM